MSADALGLFIDILVLIFLGVMIFYAVRLSESLKEFRAQKGAFDGVIADLLSAIDQAERSIHSLKQVSSKESMELDALIRKAKILTEELKDVNQASESMANRLENVAEKNRKVMQSVNEAKPIYPQNKTFETETKSEYSKTSAPKKELSKQDLPSFMIQDRDFEDLDALGERLDDATSNDVSESIVSAKAEKSKKLQSQAERELYDALISSKRNLHGR